MSESQNPTSKTAEQIADQADEKRRQREFEQWFDKFMSGDLNRPPVIHAPTIRAEDGITDAPMLYTAPDPVTKLRIAFQMALTRVFQAGWERAKSEGISLEGKKLADMFAPDAYKDDRRVRRAFKSVYQLGVELYWSEEWERGKIGKRLVQEGDVLYLNTPVTLIEVPRPGGLEYVNLYTNTIGRVMENDIGNGTVKMDFGVCEVHVSKDYLSFTKIELKE